MLECPSISETIFGCTPLVMSSVAQVAEVVEAHVAHPGPPKERLPRFVVEVGPVGGGADPGREHQTLIVPVVPCGGALGLLAPPVPPQRLDGSCGEPYPAAAAPGLGLGEAGAAPRERERPPLGSRAEKPHPLPGVMGLSNPKPGRAVFDSSWIHRRLFRWASSEPTKRWEVAGAPITE